MTSRATVADCIDLLNLPPLTRQAAAADVDARDSACREATYTGRRACSTKACKGKVRAIRAADDRPDLCTGCYLQTPEWWAKLDRPL